MAASAGPAQTVPAKGLVVYVEYDGIDAHADAWKATAAYAMFVRTPAGAMVADVTRQVVDRLLKDLPGPKPSGADLLAIEEHVVRHGLALGLYDEADRDVACVVVLNGLGRKEARERVGRLARVVGWGEPNRDQETAETFRFRGRDLYRVKDRTAATPKADKPEAPRAVPNSPLDDLAWWFEGDDLIVVAGPTAPKAECEKDDAPARLPLRIASVLDAIEGKTPGVATHPGRAAALAEGQDIQGFESNGLFFVEMGTVREIYARLFEPIVYMSGSIEGVVLPPAKSIRDDVQYFEPGPNFPFANTQAATQKARMQATGIEPKTDVPPAEDASKVAVAPPVSPDELPAPKDARRDPAVSKAGTIPGSKLEGKKNPVDPAKALGLDGVTRVIGRWGFQGQALLTDIRVEAPAPRRGLAGMLDQAGFRKDRLPPIPRGAGAFLVGSFDPVKGYEVLLSHVLKDIDVGGAAGNVDAFSPIIETVVFELTGQRLREDILGHFGPTWCLYSEPQPKTGETDRRMPTLLVEVDDAKGLGKVLDSLAKRVNAQLRPTPEGQDAKPADGPPDLALERLPAPERGYRLTSPSGVISWLGKGQEPTILVGESYLAIAASPAQAREALAAASPTVERDRWQPDGELAQAFACLPAELTSLTVGDPEDSSWPEMLVYLPKLVQHIASAFEAVEGEPAGSSTGSKLLGMLGVPRPGGFRLRINPAQVPSSDALRARLFPSVLATAIDDRGVRIVGREAIPFACAGPRFRYHGDTKEGEMVGIELSPFLFPCVQLELKHNLKSDGGAFSFSLKSSFAPDPGSDD
jgi:hypothetical protein